jgi:hypothetical protein
MVDNGWRLLLQCLVAVVDVFITVKGSEMLILVGALLGVVSAVVMYVLLCVLLCGRCRISLLISSHMWLIATVENDAPLLDGNLQL